MGHVALRLNQKMTEPVPGATRERSAKGVVGATDDRLRNQDGREGAITMFEVRARLKVRDGQLEGFKRQAAELMRLAREKDTGTLAYDWYLSADGTECEVREAYVDPDALIDHAFHVREARDVLFAEFAYDHHMGFYGDPGPRLTEMVNTIGVKHTDFSLFQALEPATVH
jgi:quinol monooxygenase YgiN